MDLAQGNITPETKYEIDLVNGVVKAKFDFVGSEAEAGAYANLKIIPLLEKLKAAIPGTIDDAVISLVQSALAAASAAPVDGEVAKPVLSGT